MNVSSWQPRHMCSYLTSYWWPCHAYAGVVQCVCKRPRRSPSTQDLRDSLSTCENDLSQCAIRKDWVIWVHADVISLLRSQ